MAVLRSAKNPVLAHEFLNFMMDETHAYENFFNFVGYQPPQVLTILAGMLLPALGRAKLKARLAERVADDRRGADRPCPDLVPRPDRARWRPERLSDRRRRSCQVANALVPREMNVPGVDIS